MSRPASLSLYVGKNQAFVSSGGRAVRRVLVTGAGRGLGLEFVRQCIARGDRVFAAVRQPDASDDLKGLAAANVERVTVLEMDVGDAHSIGAARDEVARVTDGIELLVNNAGVNSKAMPEPQKNLSFGSLQTEGILSMVRVNAIGPLLVAQAFVELLANGRDPRVLNVSSWLGSITKKKGGGNYGYCASKATLNMLGRTMAHDLIERGIVTVMFNPGWVQTDMGGPRASLTPEESVRGMLDVIEESDESHNAGFFQWDGSEHPW